MGLKEVLPTTGRRLPELSKALRGTFYLSYCKQRIIWLGIKPMQGKVVRNHTKGHKEKSPKSLVLHEPLSSGWTSEYLLWSALQVILSRGKRFGGRRSQLRTEAHLE